MTKEDFYFKYANTSLAERTKILSNENYSPLLGKSLNDVYTEISKIDDEIRPKIIRINELLKTVEWLNIQNKII
jgi:hypothetical protein